MVKLDGRKESKITRESPSQGKGARVNHSAHETVASRRMGTRLVDGEVVVELTSRTTCTCVPVRVWIGGKY